MERRTGNGVIDDSVMARSHTWLTTMAVLAFGFGALTIMSGTQVLFGDDETRAAAGDIAPFVLRFNTAAGVAYLLAAVGLFLERPWAARLALLIALATTTVFAAFGWHIATGGAFEWRTVMAMTLRSVFWILLAIGSYRALGSGNGESGSARW